MRLRTRVPPGEPRIRRLGGLAALAALWAGAVSAQERADLVLHHGKIAVVDDAFSLHQAIVIRNGRVLAVGGNELVARYRADRSIDLGGRLVIPGFDDTHIHIEGDPVWYVDLTEVGSIEEMVALIAAKARELGPGRWITGYGWSEDQLAEHRKPLRADLDRAAPDNPVVMARAGGHSAVGNGLALRQARIDRATADPDHGVIEHDEAGEPNGVVRERSDLFFDLVPAATTEELRPSFVAHLERLLSLGITSLIQAGVTPEGYREWEWAYRTYPGRLPRAAVQIYWQGAAAMQAFGRKTGDGDEWLRVGAVKMLVDGGFTGPAAYTLQPYRGQPTYRGKLNYTPDQLYQAVREGHALGWQFGLHTIGDGAIVLAVATFDRVLREAPRADHRHYLNHFSMRPPDSTLDRMARHGILVSQQPNFTYTLDGRYQANLEGWRLAHNNPLRSVLDHGVFLAFSSDILPIGPMVGLAAAVTRKGMSGRVFGADERLTMAEAIRAYTRNGAYLTREEAEKGTLEPGRLADLIVLSADLLTIAPERIADTQVDLTVLGGRIVYERRP